MIRIQTEDFDIGAELDRLTSGRTDIGATVTFTGTVRDHAGHVQALTLEHYPGMTEKELEAIEQDARDRWPLKDCLVVHRVGTLKPGENIVLVVTASEHREAAFEAAWFIMDYLKTRAPFWKRERGPNGEAWVEATAADKDARERWRQQKDAPE